MRMTSAQLPDVATFAQRPLRAALHAAITISENTFMP